MLIPEVEKGYNLNELDMAVISAIGVVYNELCPGKKMTAGLICHNEDVFQYELHYQVSVENDVDGDKFVDRLNELFGKPIFDIEVPDENILSFRFRWTPVQKYYEEDYNVSPKDANNTIIKYLENLKKNGVSIDTAFFPISDLLSDEDALPWGEVWYLEV